jgi:hypothetical protein
MRHLLNQDDEQAVLDELAHNQHRAELTSQACARRSQPQQAASWAKSARQIGDRIMLLKEAFLLSKRN